MTRRTSTKIATLLVTVILLTGATGCVELWVASNTTSFVAGWLARGLVDATSGTTCYRNGELIDCAELPADVQPGGN
jgi:hypothetical protein